MSGEDRDLQAGQDLEESGDEEITQDIDGSKKKSRTTMEEFRKLKAAGHKFQIKFDNEGVPTGDKESVAKFASYYGYLARARVPITIDNWHHDVAKELKNELWEDIKKTFNIKEDATTKKSTLTAMGISHRAYRSRIADEYITNADPNNPKNPCDKHPISQKEWDEFYNKRTSAEFVKKSNKAKELRKQLKEPHRMCSSGYRGKKSSWKPTDKIVIPGDFEGVGSTSITIGELEPRSQSSDSATIEAFSRLHALSDEISSGSIQPQEVLSRAVDRPEHSGRMRGSSSWTKKKDLYDRKVRKNVHEGCMTPAQILDLVNQATKKAKLDLINSAEIRNAARQETFKEVKEWLAMSGVQVQTPPQFFTPQQFVEAEVDSGMPNEELFRTVVSSYMPPDPSGGVQKETPCDLYLLDNQSQRIKTAEGIIIPSTVGQIVHGVPLSDQHVYIQLLKVGDDFRHWQVPGWTEEQLGDNIEGRFALRAKKKPRAKKQMAKKMAESPKVPSAMSRITRDALLEKDIIDGLTPSELTVYKLLMLQPEDEKNFEMHDCNPWGTYDGEVKFNVNVDDIVECFKREELNYTILKFYSWYWMEELSTGELPSNTITVLDPEMLAEGKFKHEEPATVDYLMRACLQYPSSYLVLPYNQDRHWVLIVVNIEKRTIHFVDSLERRNPKLYIKPFISSIYKQYLMEIGKYSPKIKTEFDWYRIKGPIQKGGKEYGYFTMLNMRVFINTWRMLGEIPQIIEPVGLPYAKEDIDAVVSEVMDFMHRRLSFSTASPSSLDCLTVSIASPSTLRAPLPLLSTASPSPLLLPFYCATSPLTSLSLLLPLLLSPQSALAAASTPHCYHYSFV
ncbi:hypothetical protein LUZ63_007385 [Rhynchospora breviuscula]|uniref:Ubiquitin-like protease family profile domain-containing protein n=1 Tax=Rhynchospora breviuscula TaxID=2022672 RepID=A0A9Q0CRL1_9POAL|nr:hypothetical protein LUZ63_007385 [Rhynchospora breviuscula]